MINAKFQNDFESKSFKESFQGIVQPCAKIIGRKLYRYKLVTDNDFYFLDVPTTLRRPLRNHLWERFVVEANHHFSNKKILVVKRLKLEILDTPIPFEVSDLSLCKYIRQNGHLVIDDVS